jgi:hypothetical protein
LFHKTDTTAIVGPQGLYSLIGVYDKIEEKWLFRPPADLDAFLIKSLGSYQGGIMDCGMPPGLEGNKLMAHRALTYLHFIVYQARARRVRHPDFTSEAPLYLNPFEVEAYFSATTAHHDDDVADYDIRTMGSIGMTILDWQKSKQPGTVVSGGGVLTKIPRQRDFRAIPLLRNIFIINYGVHMKGIYVIFCDCKADDCKSGKVPKETFGCPCLRFGIECCHFCMRRLKENDARLETVDQVFERLTNRDTSLGRTLTECGFTSEVITATRNRDVTAFVCVCVDGEMESTDSSCNILADTADLDLNELASACMKAGNVDVNDEARLYSSRLEMQVVEYEDVEAGAAGLEGGAADQQRIKKDPCSDDGFWENMDALTIVDGDIYIRLVLPDIVEENYVRADGEREEDDHEFAELLADATTKE